MINGFKRLIEVFCVLIAHKPHHFAYIHVCRPQMQSGCLETDASNKYGNVDADFFLKYFCKIVGVHVNALRDILQADFFE